MTVPPSIIIPDLSMDIIASNRFVDKKGKKQQNMRIFTRNPVTLIYKGSGVRNIPQTHVIPRALMSCHVK